MLNYVLILTAIIISYCSGFLIGFSSSDRMPPALEKPKRKVGFALHPERINLKGRPKKAIILARDEIGVLNYKSPEQIKEELNVTKKQEEEEMTKTLSKHFPITT